MKLEASTSLLPKMAKTYREYGQMKAAQGDEAASGAGLTAADAIEDVAELRVALIEALDGWEKFANQEGTPGDEQDLARVAELRKLTRP